MGQHVVYRTNKQKYEVFKTLYETWTVAAIKKRLGINNSTFEKFMHKAIKENMIEADAQKVFEAKMPFSDNEWDYGTKIKWPVRIQNSPIAKKEATQLEVAIKAYKAQFKT